MTTPLNPAMEKARQCHPRNITSPRNAESARQTKELTPEKQWDKIEALVRASRGTTPQRGKKRRAMATINQET